MALRRQLSLYVPEPQAAPIEAVRRVLDPVQHALISAHVTLCRDEETARLTTEAIEAVIADVAPIALTFGRAVSFDGHGILLPCISGADQFAALRERLLGSTSRVQSAHITLAHPRNSRAARNSLAHAYELPPEISLRFFAISLIEQSAPAEPWRVLSLLPVGEKVARSAG